MTIPTFRACRGLDVRQLFFILCLLFCLPVLSGCIPAVVGGAVGGAELVTERRTIQRVISDNSLEIKIRGVNKQDEMLANTNISVTAFNGWVLLSGEVATKEQKKKAEETAKSYEETRRVVNELEVSGLAGLASGTNDAIITGKVKSTMWVDSDVPATNVKVVTERGVVFLMGLVTKEEGEHAVQVAKNISGVRKIVKVFEYIVE
ncbi:MAG: BON domain-containing protein [Gammaproteobacteria bacterium]|nr:BON domain-containing protein [Gammaproteobacteria bacterium]